MDPFFRIKAFIGLHRYVLNGLEINDRLRTVMLYMRMYKACRHTLYFSYKHSLFHIRTHITHMYHTYMHVRTHTHTQACTQTHKQTQNTCTYTQTYVTRHEKTRLMYTKYTSLFYCTYLLCCLRY